MLGMLWVGVAALVGAVLGPALLRIVAAVPAVRAAALVADVADVADGSPLVPRWLAAATTAAWFALVAWRFAGPDSDPGNAAAAIPFAWLAAAGFCLCLIDVRAQTLPNAIVLPLAAAGAVGLTAAALQAGEPSRLIDAAGAGLALFVLYLLLALASPAGMGLGDVKLAGALGLFLGYLGWPAVVVGTAAAFVLGGCYAGVLLLRGRTAADGGIPFGPWMIVGAWVGILTA